MKKIELLHGTINQVAKKLNIDRATAWRRVHQQRDPQALLLAAKIEKQRRKKINNASEELVKAINIEIK